MIENNLERKQKYSTNKSCLLSIVAILENTILNYLVKKLTLNKLALISTILIMFLFKNLTNKVNILQIF